jgi:uncharacterized protein HemX
MFGLKLGLPRRSAPEATASPNTSPSSPGLSPIASAVVLAAGAGVAFWWWTQWARGRAESEADLAAADVAQSDVEPTKTVE